MHHSYEQKFFADASLSEPRLTLEVRPTDGMVGVGISDADRTIKVVIPVEEVQAFIDGLRDAMTNIRTRTP